MKNIIILFFFLLGSFISQLNATENFPTNTREFTLYLTKVPIDERVTTYKQILENIDTLIQETNISKKLTKIQKKRLISQYRAFKSRTQIALKKEEKKVQVNIDFQKIIQRKTSDGVTNINSGVTSSSLVSSPLTQNTIEQRPTNIQNNNTPTVSTNASVLSATNTGIINIVPNRDILISSTGTPSGCTILTTGGACLGGFSIQSGDEDVRINKLVFRNTGSARLKDAIQNVRIYSQGQGVISASTIIQDNKLYFTSLSAYIQKKTIGTFVLNSEVGSILGFFGKTIQLEWIPEESEIYPYTDANTGHITYGTGNIINNSSFPVLGAYGLAPDVRSSGANGGQGVLTSTNWNEEFDVTINSIKVEVVKNDYGSKLNGSFYLTGAFNGRFQLINDSENSIVNIDSSILGAGITVKKGVPFVLSYSLDGSYNDFYPRIIISEVIYTALGKKFKAIVNGGGNLGNPLPID